MSAMGQLLRRSTDGDEVIAEWTPSDPASVQSAQATYRHWLDQDYMAVQSDDGAHYKPLTGDELPVDAEQVVLSVAMGGG
jgi:hypothetical protein